MWKNSLISFLTLGATAFMPGAVRAAEPFALTSTAFKDGDTMAAKYAGAFTGRTCGGENVSPQLSWSHAPEKTKSFAIVVYDPDGGRGTGSNHWVAYGIPASKPLWRKVKRARRQRIMWAAKIPWASVIISGLALRLAASL